MNKQQATFELTPADLTLKHPELGTGPIPTDMYWQPEFYDREMEAIYKRAWLCVGRVEQVKAPGDFFVKEIKTFMIFDRWGNQVFGREAFQPNDPNYGWDGNFEGRPLNAAVFAFYAEVEFVDGWIEMIEGDITLMR